MTGTSHVREAPADPSDEPAWNSLPAIHERAALYEVLDRYLEALQARAPRRAPWASVVRATQNNVQLHIGDGLWRTICGLGRYDLRFADLQSGQVGLFGAIEEAEAQVPYALRLKVVDDRITEVEEIIVRKTDLAMPFPEPAFVDKPIMNEIVPPQRRRARARMVSIADGYFDTLQLNDGTLFTPFADSCNRVENGVQTTNNPDSGLMATARLGCAEQFKLGIYRYDDRLRARRYPLIDEERGLVLAGAFIDHCGHLDRYQLTDGTPARSFVRHPHSFCLLELFKIADGKIEQVEANFITVPYHMPSPWSVRSPA